MRQRLIAAFGAALILALVAPPHLARADVEHWKAVLVAGDTAQPVFDNAVRAVNTWLGEQGVLEADIHRLSAGAGPRDPRVEPATLRRVLDRIAGLQSRPGDGCFVFITSHGGRGLGIYLSREDEMLRPTALARALAQGCAGVPTVVIVSGCYSGAFARAPMAAPNRVILTAARADRSSFGCAADRTYTDYDACLLGAFAHAPSWQAVSGETKGCVARRERQLGETPSLPQASFGAAVRKLPLQFSTMPRRVLAALAGMVLAASAARGDGLDDIWEGTHWGETDPALLQHFGARATVLPAAIDFGDSYAQLVLRQFALGGYGLIVYYQIDKKTHGLKRIQLERPRHSVNPPVFRGVLAALEAAYGSADQACGARPGRASGYQGASDYVWSRGGLVIRAIFRDTTLEALGGCYSPACGLTGQLLVRISPPEGDDAQCHPAARMPPDALRSGTRG